MTNLKQALKDVASDLSSFAASKNFWSVFGDVFGTGYTKPAAHAIFAQLSRGDLSQLARVEVVSASLLGPAQAAYASANGTIYLSDRFLAQASLPQLKAALLEEIGHAIDARVNASDRPGDEGELFSLLARGITPTASERQRMLAEDDRRTITINGVTLQVEQTAPVVYETTKVNFFNSSHKISGTNAIWTEAKRANRTLRFFNGTSSSIVANSVYNGFGDIAISGATIAYTKSDGQDLEVYRVSAGVTTRLTTNTNYDSNLLIDGNTIVWQSYDATDTGDIYRNNGTTTTRITSNTVQEEDVQLSGSQLLWAASDGNDYEIYLNDGITTRALTNNTLDDYSPVLSGNRAAWFQWNNNQENLFFYDGSIAKKITTNLDISDPLIAGSNLVYKQRDASGTTSLKFYNATTGTTSQLSANLGSFTQVASQVAASGNLVAWLEPGGDSGSVGPVRSTLKLFNGSTTTTIATNVIQVIQNGSFALRGSKIFYLGTTQDNNNNYSGELYLYDAASSTPASTQLTVGESDSQIQALGVNGNSILWSDGSDLKLTQPSTKPILSFSSPSLSVVEGFTSPQNASLSVTLSAASSVPVTVRYETFTNYNDANEAYSGSDYTQTTGTLTFAAGVTSQTINVPIINDTGLESDETFYVRLLEPSNAVLVPGQNTATITISDTWQTTGANGSTFTLPADVENLTLTGSTNINGVGNANRNEIRGNSGNNRLSGGGGFDNLIGGLGNDTYIVSKSSSFESTPLITENANEGTDTVEFASTASNDGYTLFQNNLENLIITGSGNHSGYGNDGNNVISGNSGNNYLNGSGGIDTVSYADAPGPAGVTVSLTKFGGSASGWGTDNLDDFENIIGSGFNDTLSGDSASNTITGNAGKDTITGNGGSDKFDYRTLSQSALAAFDRITDFDATTTGDRFLVSTARAGFLNGGQVSTLLTDAALTAAAISTKLTTTNFLANFAATITMGSGVTSRTFVVINNTVAGFNALGDAVVEVSGFSGTFNTSQFVIS
jgi:hypothetical protein